MNERAFRCSATSVLIFALLARQPRERFRVCYNQYGQSCTEWETANFLVACGC